MTQEMDWEAEQVREEARQMKDSYQRLLRGQQLLQAEELQRRANDAYAEGIRAALSEAGIPPEQWHEIYYGVAESVPTVSKTLGKKLASKLVAKASKKAGMARDAKSGQWVKAGEQGAQAQDGIKGLKEIAAARQSGKLDSNKALDRMIEQTLGDYFANSLGGKK